MIPTFPIFKEIEIADKAVIQKFTSKYRPYSDFNFTNLWSWNTKGKHRVALLHGNLVIIFSDYLTEEPCLSLLGTERLRETVTELAAYAQQNGMTGELRYIPEELTHQLRKEGFSAEEDEENFDYIFSVKELATLKGNQFKTKRQSSHKFERENPDARYAVEDITDFAIRAQLISIFETWREKRISDTKYDIGLEAAAFKRLIETAEEHELVLSCVYVGNTMLGFSLDEILPHGYAISHFLKADTAFKGIYEFLNEHTAKHLLSKGVELWNWEQDLNIQGLRRLKRSYKPVQFLKKYRISIKRGRPSLKNLWPLNLLRST